MCLQPVINDWGSLNTGFLSCDASPACAAEPEPDGRGELRVKPEAAAAAGAAASLSLTQESRVLPASTQLGQASQLASGEDKTSAPSAF